MQEHIKGMKSEIVVKLGEAEMTVGDLVTLEKGDIIPLNQEASGEVTAEVQGVDKMKCLIGTYKGNRAVQVTHVDRTPKGNMDMSKYEE